MNLMLLIVFLLLQAIVLRHKKTGRKLEFNGKEPVGFDRNKVECFNCDRRGHFSRDFRSARNSQNRSRDDGNAGKRPTKEEDEQALVVQDGLEGLDKGMIDFNGFSAFLKFMENKPGIDNLDIDDLYNNLKVYEADIKGSSRSSSNLQNVDFVFAESTNNTNELNAAYSVSTTTGHSS
nr:ribonuclease H-like domain-containing protein [Tanacetum cinerariifolium]